MKKLSKQEIEIIATAMQAALSVGEIHFETCVLSKQVKYQLLAALRILES